jgi:hypothetical protein
MPLAGPSQRWLQLVGPAVIGLALATCACGGGSTAGVASLGTTTTAAPAAAAAKAASGSAAGSPLAEYATCMRSHGVLNFPGPASFGSSDGIRAAKGQMVQVSRSEGSSPTFQAAQRACAQYDGPPTTSQQISALELRKLLAVSRCMRSHGVPNFPDPNPTTGAMNPPASVDRSSPQVIAALRACSSLGEAAGLGPPST